MQGHKRKNWKTKCVISRIKKMLRKRRKNFSDKICARVTMRVSAKVALVSSRQ